MSIQAKAAEIEWRRWSDEDTYYPLRDDQRAINEHGRPRQYAARWVIEARSVREQLTQGQIAIAEHVRSLSRRTRPHERTNFEHVDCLAFNNKEIQRLKRLDEKHELAGFEAVAAGIRAGRPCFHGICEEDSLAQIQRRCGLVRDHRSAIELVRCVLHALELYAGFNDQDVELWNARA